MGEKHAITYHLSPITYHFKRVNHMRGCVSLLCMLSIALSCGACSGSAPGGANQSGAANAAAPASAVSGAGQNVDAAKLDAEIAQLEQQAGQNPDNALLATLADAYVRRGNALHEAHRLMDALRDYQSALKFSPDHEEANLRVAQITQEIGAEPHAEDGKPVSVPAKPETNEKQ
jgi:tetratricopeptide (TPR) repeat protein